VTAASITAHEAITLMITAAITFETSVKFCQSTRRNIPEDNHIHTRRRENLKSHDLKQVKSREGSF
jgi:hypothetical protein